MGFFMEEMRKRNIDSKISWPLKAAKYERTRLKMYPVTMMKTKHSPIWSNRPSRKACLQGKQLKGLTTKPFEDIVPGRVSVQGVKSLGGHFACLCWGCEIYEEKKMLLFFKKKMEILLHF